MLKARISASMMCASLLNLRHDVSELENSGADYLHIDIMDGVFVPNIMLNNSYIKAIRKITNIPLDIHLMIVQPENKLSWFDIEEGDLVSIHYESTSNVLGTLQLIESMGGKAGVALSPATPIESISYVLENLSFVNILSVNPGFAGRSMAPMSMKKINDARKFLDENGRENVMIEVDGNVTWDNAKKMRQAGADVFVGGSSGLFLDFMTISDAMVELKKAVV